MPKIRVLVNSYSARGVASYSVIARALWTRLVKSGEVDIIQLGFFHKPILDNVPWQIIQTQLVQDPQLGVVGFDKKDQWGEISFPSVVQQFKPDIVWSLADLYMVRYVPRFARKYGFKQVYWSLTPGDPIDRTDVPMIATADACVSMTDYAANHWKRHTDRDYPVIPLGVDTKIFRPVSREEKADLRAVHTKGRVGTDDFLILYVGRNQERKRPWIPFEVLHYLRTGAWGIDDRGVPHLQPWDPHTKSHLENPQILFPAKPVPAHLWVHSAEQEGRWSFKTLSERWQVEPGVLFTDNLGEGRGLDEADMAVLYKMSDCLSMVSGAEGFGVPLIEAAAVGIPSVYTDYSGCGEVGAKTLGYPVRVSGFNPSAGNHINVANPDVAHAVSQFYQAFEDRNSDMAQIHSESRIRIVNDDFNWDSIAMDWLKLLREVHARKPIHTMGALV